MTTISREDDGDGVKDGNYAWRGGVDWRRHGERKMEKGWKLCMDECRYE